MHIYFSGIGGVGLGPLAEMAHDAGFTVTGSDAAASPMTEQLIARGITVAIGQDGNRIAATHAQTPIEWLVYTAALAEDHPELVFAREHGIRTSKRDELLAELIRQKDLKLIAVSGTHGKTTTTGMLVWAFKQLGIPLSYAVGSSLDFADSGAYDASSSYFVYECDEYDRNMLKFRPEITVITALDYDHPDSYPTPNDYQQAFVDFINQSAHTLLWQKDLHFLDASRIVAPYEVFDAMADLLDIALPGEHVRQNAFLAWQVLQRLFPERERRSLLYAINSYPGSGRRFEKLDDNLYSDYGHHPAEIAATLQLARELNDRVVLVYQPHQNVRQHELQHHYKDCMNLAEDIYWLPTYLTRENPALRVLTPDELTAELDNAPSVHIADKNDELWQTIQDARAVNKLVVVMGAGDIDAWVREHLTE